MAQLVDITDEHLVDLHPRLKSYTSMPFPYMRMTVRAYKNAGPSHAGVHEGRCFGIGGVVPVQKGVWHTWMMLSDDIAKHPKWFLRLCKSYVASMEENGIHRLQADIPADMKDWLAILERMGFENEGLMRAFSSDKQDYYRIAYIKV